MKKISKKLSYLGYIALVTVPYFASAQVPPPQTISGVWDLVCMLFGWLFILIMFAAVVYIILAAYNYLTANGDAKKVEKANHMLLYAVIGVVVAVLARNIPKIAANVVGLNTSSGLAGTNQQLPECLR